MAIQGIICGKELVNLEKLIHIVPVEALRDWVMEGSSEPWHRSYEVNFVDHRSHRHFEANDGCRQIITLPAYLWRAVANTRISVGLSEASLNPSAYYLFENTKCNIWAQWWPPDTEKVILGTRLGLVMSRTLRLQAEHEKMHVIGR